MLSRCAWLFSNELSFIYIWRRLSILFLMLILNVSLLVSSPFLLLPTLPELTSFVADFARIDVGFIAILFVAIFAKIAVGFIAVLFVIIFARITIAFIAIHLSPSLPESLLVSFWVLLPPSLTDLQLVSLPSLQESSLAESPFLLLSLVKLAFPLSPSLSLVETLLVLMPVQSLQ